MTMQLHGLFLITGETVPLDPALRRELEVGLRRALRRVSAKTPRLRVTLIESADANDDARVCCRIRAWLRGARDLEAEGIGEDARQAILRSLRQVRRVLAETGVAPR